jgi:hypothetical protein
LRPDRVYLADKPPAPGAVSSSHDVETTEPNVPYLSRKAKRQSPPKSAAAVPVRESDSNLLRFSRDEEEHIIRVDLPAVMSRSQPATLVFEYSGALNSADSSPLEGVQLAKIHDETSYLLAISRWFPMNRYLKDRATATFRITVPQGIVVAMDGTAQPKQQRGDRDVYTFACERPTFPGSLAASKFNTLPASAGKVEVTYYIKDNKRDFVEAQSETIGKILDLYSNKFGAYPGRLAESDRSKETSRSLAQGRLCQLLCLALSGEHFQ